MKKQTILMLIIAVLMLCSCATQRRCNDRFPQVQSTNIKDSTVITYETRYFDSIIYKIVEIPKLVVRDSVVIRYENGEAKTDKLILKGRYSEAVVYILNNVLKGQLTESGWIPIQLKIQMQERLIKELRDKNSASVKVIEKEFVSPFKWFQIWGFRIISLAALLYFGIPILIKFLKKSINPLA